MKSADYNLLYQECVTPFRRRGQQNAERRDFRWSEVPFKGRGLAVDNYDFYALEKSKGKFWKWEVFGSNVL